MFRYTKEGPVSLENAKTVISVPSRGGVYAGSPYEAAMDHQEAYLRAVLTCRGITDLSNVPGLQLPYPKAT
jgi:FMN-dependent NADH-azoreductase